MEAAACWPGLWPKAWHVPAPKSLLVTSSLPSEGKTTTAANIAISLAQTGAKVLIIDADMRRPRLHQVFNTSNGEGLSTLLSKALSEAEVLAYMDIDLSTDLNALLPLVAPLLFFAHYLWFGPLPLAADARWKALPSRVGYRPWTDDYSNVFSVIRW